MTLKFYHDPQTNEQFGFEHDIVINQGEASFTITTVDGRELGPYQGTLVEGQAPAPMAPRSHEEAVALAFHAALQKGVLIEASGMLSKLSGLYHSDSAPGTAEGKYDSDAMANEVAFLAVHNEFLNPSADGSLSWQLKDGTPVRFGSKVEFLPVAKAVARYVAACRDVRKQLMAGLEGVSWPSNEAKIS